jgi:hypothetical protein
MSRVAHTKSGRNACMAMRSAPSLKVFFNAFNRVQFYGPTSNGGSTGGSSQFGQVSTDSPASNSPYYRGPRILHFALKFYF